MNGKTDQKATESPGAPGLQVIDGEKFAGSIPPFAKKPIRTVKDAKKMLGKIIHAFQLGKVKTEEVKTLAYLLTSWVNIVRDVEYEERLKAVERRLLEAGNERV